MRCLAREEDADRVVRREGIATVPLENIPLWSTCICSFPRRRESRKDSCLAPGSRPSRGGTQVESGSQIKSAPACRGFQLGVPALIAILVTGPHAQAQALLNAEYLATLSGIPIGKGRVTVDISDDRYSMAASGATAGLMRLFSSGHGSGSVQGALAGGTAATAHFNARITSAKKIEEYRLTIAGGEVTDFSVTPPPPQSDRVPLNDAHRRGVNDPMSATLIRVPGNGNPVGPEACRRTLSVFDGRMRYDVQLAYKRSEMIHAAHGYSGPAVVCMVTFVPIAGHNPERPAVRYLIRLRDMEAWLAPIVGTRVMVPVRIVIPTPFGLGLMQAVKFDAVAQQAATRAKAP